VLSSFTALAAVTVKDTDVSVGGLMNNDVVKFYQVLTWNQTAGEWQLAEGFGGLTSNSTVFPADTDDNTSREQEVVAAIIAGISQEQANAIAAQTALATGGPSMKGSAVTVSNATSATATDGTASYTVPTTTDDSGLGLYMGVITAGNPSYIYNPVFMAADFDNTNPHSINAATESYSGSDAIAKKQEITVTKTTKDTEDAWQQAIDSYKSQTVHFKVETDIPVFLDSYKNPSFVLNDVISSGIALTSGSISVKLGSAEAVKTLDTTERTIAENGTTGYTVTFKPAWLGEQTTATHVVIEYDGTITNDAEFNLNEDNNTVTVTYSNGPDTETAALRDRTNHYTFSLGAKALGQDSASGKTYELVKVAVDSQGNPIVEENEVSSWHSETKRHPLAGATFELFSNEECTEHVGIQSPYTCTTGDDGVITFLGLAAGNYWLVEKSAPTGYVKDTRKVHIEIVAHYTDVTVADTTEGGIKVKGYDTQVLDWYEVKVNNVSTYNSQNGKYEAQAENYVVDTKYQFTNNGPHTETMTTTESHDSDLTNTQGVELPSTGGMGTTILYVGGSILVILAAILLITKRRMSADE